MSLKPSHVIILGSGLAGPCLALLLAQQGIPSTIYEIRSQRTESGGSISLGPEALHVLDKAGVYEALREEGYTYTSMTAYTEDGERLGSLQVGTKRYPGLRILRSSVANVLVDAAEATGMVQIKYGMKCNDIEEGESGVTLRFEDGTTDSAPILIGCDGIHSFARKHVLNNDAPTPTFDGTCVVTNFLPTASAALPDPDFTFPAMMFTPAGLFMAIPINKDGSTLAWGITKSSPQRTREEWRHLEQSGEAARVAKADFAAIHTQPTRSLIDESEDAAAKVWAPYIIPELPSWHTERVLLIGDAAHGMSPNGLGSALAFEDTALLSRLLIEANFPSYSDLFSRFEALRRPRVLALSKSRAQGLKQPSGPWVWYMKKWAFRAFFWWKSGLIRHNQDTEYDVGQVVLEEAVGGKK